MLVEHRLAKVLLVILNLILEFVFIKHLALIFVHNLWVFSQKIHHLNLDVRLLLVEAVLHDTFVWYSIERHLHAHFIFHCLLHGLTPVGVNWARELLASELLLQGLAVGGLGL